MEELGVADLAENQLLDFLDDLEDFPYAEIEDEPETEDEQRRFIVNLMIKLNKQPDLLFGVAVPTGYALSIFSLYTLVLSAHSLSTYHFSPPRCQSIRRCLRR